MLVQDLNVPIVDPDEKKDRIALLVDYFTANRNNHVWYANMFYFCELLNFVNVLGQIFFMDFFLGGEFSTYGTDVISMTSLDQEEREDPMARVFPKMTKCTFHKFGPSGTVERFDGLCVLPLNIINEKIYVFLWFWFVLVAVVSGLQVILRLFQASVPSTKASMLHQRSRLTPMFQIQAVCRHVGGGDWFLIYQLGKNIDSLIFREFIDALYKRIKAKDSSAELT